MAGRYGKLKRLSVEVKNPFRDKRCKYGIESVEAIPAGSLWREAYHTVTLKDESETEYLAYLEILRTAKSKVIWSPSGEVSEVFAEKTLIPISEAVDVSSLPYTQVLPFYTVDEADILPALVAKGVVSNEALLAVIKELDDMPFEEWPKM